MTRRLPARSVLGKRRAVDAQGEHVRIGGLGPADSGTNDQHGARRPPQHFFGDAAEQCHAGAAAAVRRHADQSAVGLRLVDDGIRDVTVDAHHRRTASTRDTDLDVITQGRDECGQVLGQDLALPCRHTSMRTT